MFDDSRPRKTVVVVGGGLVGVATANFLARVGNDVVVVERGPDVALGTSFANAGRFCPAALVATEPPSLDKAKSAVITMLRPIWAPVGERVVVNFRIFPWAAIHRPRRAACSVVGLTEGRYCTN